MVISIEIEEQAWKEIITTLEECSLCFLKRSWNELATDLKRSEVIAVIDATYDLIPRFVSKALFRAWSHQIHLTIKHS